MPGHARIVELIARLQSGELTSEDAKELIGVLSRLDELGGSLDKLASLAEATSQCMTVSTHAAQVATKDLAELANPYGDNPRSVEDLKRVIACQRDKLAEVKEQLETIGKPKPKLSNADSSLIVADLAAEIEEYLDTE